MKKMIVVLLSAAAISQAAIVKFDLSPAGSDAGVGLSPLNEIPPVTNSTGSGNAISGGITFDTTTATLQFAIGYGSNAGFSNLTGPATAMHIHGPGTTNQAAGVLFDLVPFNFSAADPANGGVIFGSVVYPTNLVADLLAGLNYVNIHTATNAGGEIRGQLIPAINSPPTISCPPSSMVECGFPTTETVVVSDADGDALTIVWSLNGTVVQTNALPAGAPGASANVSFTASLPLGTNIVAVSVSDTSTNVTSCSATVIVVDTTPPVIVRSSATPNSLWPPNHKYVDVKVSALVQDTCSTTTWKIVSIKSSEPINGLGDGDTAPDWQITGDHTAKLRAERSGKGNGRTYTITIVGKDTSGNESTPATVTVKVPKNQSGK